MSLWYAYILITISFLQKRIMFLYPKSSSLHLLQSREEKQSASNYTHKILTKEAWIRMQSTAYRAQLITKKSKSIPGAESLSHSATVKTVAQHLSKLQSPAPERHTPYVVGVRNTSPKSPTEGREGREEGEGHLAHNVKIHHRKRHASLACSQHLNIIAVGLQTHSLHQEGRFLEWATLAPSEAFFELCCRQ